MQEDKQDSQRTDILDQENVQVEETSTQCPPVRELVAYCLMGHKPSDEDTGQEAYYWQEYLSRDEVEPVEQRLAKEASDRRQHPNDNEQNAPMMAVDTVTIMAASFRVMCKLLLEEGRRHLMQRHQRRQGSQ